LFEPGRNCWRVERVKRAALVVDAADYYRHAMQAMIEAKHQIMLIGWDFDTRIRLVDGDPPCGAPNSLGGFITWLAERRPELHIHILAWDQGLLSVPARGTTFFRLLRWGTDPQIHVKWDGVHPLGGSHHQKILTIDDRVAFCGGIDMTDTRWDTRCHRDREPGRRHPFTRRRYSPWHDATMAVDGDMARAIGDLARIRWHAATGEHLPVPPRGDHDPWPDGLEPHFEDSDIAIARTRGAFGALAEIREIEALFVELIRCAERYVYVETQYFASRVIAEAIAKRLEEDDPPEFVIINPKQAYGWLDETVMSPARYELMKALAEKDKKGRFRIYYPVTEQGEEIYVHAKIMIVDDRALRVGSANMNNRSMGLDSECDLAIDVSDDDRARSTVAELRSDLLGEHLGVEPAEIARCFAETGSLIGCIEKMRGDGRSLVPLEPEEPNAALKKMAKDELLDPESAEEGYERRARPGLLKRLRGRGGSRSEPAAKGLVGRENKKRRSNMSRIPSKAMPHAFAPEAEQDIEEAAYAADRPSLGERAGAIADKVRGSRAAQVAAGAVVAGAVAAAATAVVRSRRSDGANKAKSDK
jgi:phospholipase D1/2